MKPKLLVIEEESLRRSAFEGLFGELGCDLVVADSLEKALGYLKEDNCFDVIIFNLGISGTELNDFLRRLEVHDAWKAIPLVPYTIYLEYRFTAQERMRVYLLSRDTGSDLAEADSESRLTRRIIRVVMKYISLVPGEIIQWTAFHLKQREKELSDNFERALKVLEPRKDKAPSTKIVSL